MKVGDRVTVTYDRQKDPHRLGWLGDVTKRATIVGFETGGRIVRVRFDHDHDGRGFSTWYVDASWIQPESVPW